MPSAKKSPKEPKHPPAEFQAFSDARGRPSIFVFVAESLGLKHVLLLRNALGAQAFDEVDLVINCGGGSVHAAYQIIELLRLHAKRINACVPFYAKSAATLLCIGADSIVVDELAQLGPLDTQIFEEKKPGQGEYTSALNPFKTLEQLQKFSLETLDVAVKMISMRSGMSLNDCLTHGIEFVRATTGPLFTQLDPAKLGEYSRALSVGTEYGDRLLRRFKKWDNEQRAAVLEKLVHGYPSHDYIIDYHELQEIGFDAILFEEEERAPVRALYKYITGDETLIECVTPTLPVEAAPPGTSDEGTNDTA